MKKLGIITFHNVHSFGATLQCFALFKFLIKNGYDVKVIDYSINAFLELRNNTFCSRVIRIIKNILNPRKLKLKVNAIFIRNRKKKFLQQLNDRNLKFDKFQRDYLELSEEKYVLHSELKKNPPEYDAYICGSDQIWNPYFCDMDDNYYLFFAEPEKRIAYAPSFGVSKLPETVCLIYKDRLNSFKHLSIREESGAKIIEELTGRNVPVVIDPTFLLGINDWNELIQKSDVDLPEKYILTYFIGIDSNVKKFIDLAQETYKDFKFVNLIFDESCYGPLDFLKMIKNASFVFTNSFHGIALSINLNVPFACVKTLKDNLKGNGFARIDDLMRKLQLTGRIYNDSIDLNEDFLKLDYSNVNRLKEKWINESAKYLIDAIEQC